MSSNSKTGIVNIALSHLGISKELGNLETDRSLEASTGRRYFDTARDKVLRDFHWPFATRIEALGLVEEDPNTEWGFSYRYPVNCLRIERFLSGLRNDTLQSKSPYKIVSDDTGLLIYSDLEDAEIEYTVRATNIIIYPADFVIAFSFYLANLMAPRVTGGDQFKLGRIALNNYEIEISKAQANAINEEQPDQQVDSEFIRDRS